MQEAAWAVGWAYRRKKSGMMWLSPDGVHQVLLHGTDSDHRAIKNAAAQFKRAGLDL